MPRHRHRLATAAVLLAAAVGAVARAGAEPVTLAGITFSDELGGVVLRDGWGRGTAADPFVLVEDITDDGPAVLVVRGLDAGPVGTGGAPRTGFSLRKVVTNRTGRPWTAFELELRERLGEPSSYEDGLSFGQAVWAERAFAADRFTGVDAMDEPLDAVVFSGGSVVSPGETVTVTFAVTDYTPLPAFYLLQRREGPVAGRGRGQRNLATTSVELSTPILP